ncbi:zinc ribbon domain-containing protein [Stutzerimonas kunmingensis]|uniref:zinc ribbon domain-containing protein n=1 Tax=Stutzerimonas kunmingensis TaxID=1211807 RepID=UPI0037CCD53E
MPIYEYDCDACGDFTALRPMSVRSEPCDCPACGTPSPRVIRTAPGLATMAGSTRAAHETNERASHAPKTVTEYAASKRHPAGCSCCGPSKPVVPTKANPHALKVSPSNRPWMISH